MVSETCWFLISWFLLSADAAVVTVFDDGAASELAGESEPEASGIVGGESGGESGRAFGLLATVFKAVLGVSAWPFSGAL